MDNKPSNTNNTPARTPTDTKNLDNDSLNPDSDSPDYAKNFLKLSGGVNQSHGPADLAKIIEALNSESESGKLPSTNPKNSDNNSKNLIKLSDKTNPDETKNQLDNKGRGHG